ncbi:hypothetical protein KBA84_02975 [Patescibacteria group bacterium]|nr:hypothetical protein [Patescibacteria group bacterium]
MPFNDQLFDTSSLVLNSPVYVAIVKALDKVQGDKIDFINTLLLNMAKIPDTQFIRKFKVTKVIFIQELRNAILPGLYEDASN